MGKEKHVITVGVYGGLVQWIKGIPKNICVMVRDYDVNGAEPDCLIKDEEGSACVESRWECEDLPAGK